MTTDFFSKLEAFAKLLEAQQIERLHQQDLACDANIAHARTNIKNGKKFVKVDVGNSGKYMVEVETGNIFGIKGYGVVHRGHWYGTLDTINEYQWGDYYPVKIKGAPLPTGRTGGSCPGLTFSPESKA